MARRKSQKRKLTERVVTTRDRYTFGRLPTDLAQGGNCAGASRAVERMRPGLARDYERERVSTICHVRQAVRGTRGRKVRYTRSGRR